MRKTLLAVAAGLGMLAAGCTNTPAEQPGAATPAAVTTTEQTPTPDLTAQQTITDMRVGGPGAFLDAKPSPFDTASSGCVLRGDAVTHVIGDTADGRPYTLLVEHPAESVWQVTDIKTLRKWTFTEGNNMRGILVSDDTCPRVK